MKKQTGSTRKLRALQWILVACMLCLAGVANAQENKAAEAAPAEAPKAAKAGDTTATVDKVAVPAAGKKEKPQENGAAYDLRVKELEEKVNDLKEKIFRSKSQLVLLKETVLRGKIAGSKAVLVYNNDMGNSFKLEESIFSLDGNQIYNKRDQDGDLSDKDNIELFNGAIVPGKHNISVQVIYRGNGYGVFKYLQGYKFTIRSSYTFTAEEGKTTRVKIVGYEKGNFTTALKDRPDISYEVEFFDESKEKNKELKEGSASR